MSGFSPEPCGRCGHDVNDHAYDEENEMAHDCEQCGCDGFITKTVRTEAKFEPLAVSGGGDQ